MDANGTNAAVTHALLYVLMLILLYELLMIASNSGTYTEYFSANPPTKYVLSNSPGETAVDEYLDIDEEFKIGQQKSRSSERKWSFKYVRAPVNASVVLRARTVSAGKLETIKTAIIRITPSGSTGFSFNVEEMFSTNGVLMPDAGSDMYYYIKFLSSRSLEQELKAKQAQDIKINLYNRCLMDRKGFGMSNNKIIASCQKSIE